MGAITQVGLLFVEPRNRPLSAAGQFQPGCYLTFTASGVLAPVYKDALLLWPHNQTSIPGFGPPSKYAVTSGVQADGTGRFPPIYLDPSLSYSYTLYSATGTVLETWSPVTVPDTLIALEAVKPFPTSVGSATAAGSPIIDPHLQIAIPAAGTYRIEGDYSFAESGSLGLCFEVAYSGTLNANAQNTLSFYGVLDYTLGGAQAVTSAIQLNTVSTFTNISALGVNNFLRISGTAVFASAGVLSIKWGLNTVGNAILTLASGASLYATKLG